MSRSSAPAQLVEILLRGVELVQDRRKTRYVRLRKAAPEPQVKLDEAVDPALDAVAQRLARRRSR